MAGQPRTMRWISKRAWEHLSHWFHATIVRLPVSFGFVVLADCSALLRRSRVEDISPLQSYDAAREALESVVHCRSYTFRFGNLKQERRGSFVADFPNFRRIAMTHGWRFEGIMRVRDGVVLFRNHGGQPNIERVEDRMNPLGPLQAMGESALRGLMP